MICLNLAITFICWSQGFYLLIVRSIAHGMQTLFIIDNNETDVLIYLLTVTCIHYVVKYSCNICSVYLSRTFPLFDMADKKFISSNTE